MPDAIREGTGGRRIRSSSESRADVASDRDAVPRREGEAGLRHVGPEAGVDGPVGDHEPQPVYRGDLAAARAGREFQGDVVVDDPGVGGDQRFGPQVVAGDVLQPRLAQRRDGLIDERGAADVAGLGNKEGADADLQVRQPRAGLVLVVKPSMKPVLAAISNSRSGRSVGAAAGRPARAARAG